MINLTNKKFNMLIAIKYMGNSDWLCKCECGNETVVKSYRLKSNHTKSCGCLHHPNLENKTFSYLTVTKYEGNSRWLCKCKCGKYIYVDTGKLNSGNTKSCGCLAKELTSKRFSKKYKEASINTIYTYYKKNAIKRGLLFDLSVSEFIEIATQICYYCGTEPFNYVNDNKTHKYNGSIIYNGIDRKNNDVGYILQNCVPCCKKCNLMKLNHSETEFYDHIKKIANFKKILF